MKRFVTFLYIPNQICDIQRHRMASRPERPYNGTAVAIGRAGVRIKVPTVDVSTCLQRVPNSHEQLLSSFCHVHKAECAVPKPCPQLRRTVPSGLNIQSNSLGKFRQIGPRLDRAQNATDFPLSIDSLMPWCTTPIEAESSLGPDSHHPIISLSGIPSAVMVLRILHPILASTLCAANPLARIAEPTIAL